MGKKGAPVGNQNAKGHRGGTLGKHGPRAQLNGQHLNNGALRSISEKEKLVLLGTAVGITLAGKAIGDKVNDIAYKEFARRVTPPPPKIEPFSNELKPENKDPNKFLR